MVVTVTVTYCLLGCDAVWSGTCLPVFQRIMLPPSSGLLRNDGKYLLDCIAPLNVGMFMLLFPVSESISRGNCLYKGDSGVK